MKNGHKCQDYCSIDCGVLPSGIQNTIDFYLRILCYLIKWNDGEPTKFGLIFTKETFLNVYMKSTNDKNCTLSEKIYPDLFYWKVSKSKPCYFGFPPLETP